MKVTTTRLLALTAFAFLSAAAHADEAEGSQYGIQFTSTRPVAEVRAEALRPLPITNGSTGFIGVMQSGVRAEDVKAQAVAAVRSGDLPHGEIGTAM